MPVIFDAHTVLTAPAVTLSINAARFHKDRVLRLAATRHILADSHATRRGSFKEIEGAQGCRVVLPAHRQVSRRALGGARRPKKPVVLSSNGASCIQTEL